MFGATSIEAELDSFGVAGVVATSTPSADAFGVFGL